MVPHVVVLQGGARDYVEGLHRGHGSARDCMVSNVVLQAAEHGQALDSGQVRLPCMGRLRHRVWATVHGAKGKWGTGTMEALGAMGHKRVGQKTCNAAFGRLGWNHHVLSGRVGLVRRVFLLLLGVGVHVSIAQG